MHGVVVRGVLVVWAGLLLSGCTGDAPPLDADGSTLDPLWGQASFGVPGTYSVFPGDYNVTGNVSQVLEKGPFDVLPGEKVYLTSLLDGADIDLTIWRADTPDDVKQPVIIQASPYYGDTSNPGGSDASFGQWNLDNFVPHGYVYVQLAIRSTGDSGGCDDFRGPNMVADMDQAITWLAEQEWSNGNVALTGISYPGGTPWYAAGSGNPHIKTIVPASGTMDAWEVYLHNGTPESRAPIIVASYGSSPFTNNARSTEHKVENVPCAETYQFWATATTSGATGERIDPAWWDERNGKPAVEANYQGSVFIVHGLDDWNVDPAVAYPWVDSLNRSGMHVKQLLGQWQHEWPDSDDDEASRWDWAEVLKRWYDKWLKEEPVDTGPPVLVQDNQFRWRDEANWPPWDTQWKRFQLRSDGTLGPEPGPAASALLSVPETGTLAGAPSQSPVMLDFRMPVEQELLIAGLPKVHVTARPVGPGGFLSAWIYDEAPDGTLTRVGWSGLNLRYAEGGRTPQDVTPGAPLVAQIELQPLDAAIPAGHNLLVRLWMEPPEDRVVPAPGTPVYVDYGGTAVSELILPVIERDESVFYDVPRPPEEEDELLPSG